MSSIDLAHWGGRGRIDNIEANLGVLSGAAPFSVTDTRFAGGAKGDGVADDTAAIQAAADHALSVGNGVAFCPPGTYKTTSTITLGDGVRLVGSGMLATTIKGTFAGALVSMSSPSVQEFESWVEELTLDGVSTANGGTGVAVVTSASHSGRQSGLNRVRCQNLAKGVNIYSTQQFAFVDCRFTFNTVGTYYTSNEPSTGVPQQVRFEGCYWDYNTTGLTGSYTAGSKPYGWTFWNCHWESNTGSGIVAVEADHWAFYSCKWEQNGSYAIDFSGCPVFLFTGCYFNNNSKTDLTEQIRNVNVGLGATDGATFIRCEFGGLSTQKDARFDYCASIVFDGCQFGGNNSIVNNRSAIRYEDLFYSLPGNPGVASQKTALAWITSASTVGANRLFPIPFSAAGVGNDSVYIDRVQIQVTDAFTQTGGTFITIGIGTENSPQVFAQNTSVLTTGIKTPIWNTQGFYNGADNYIAATLSADGTGLLTGKALVIVDYYVVPLKP